MKSFFQKNHLILIFSSLLVLIFVIGGMYSRFMTRQITFHQFKDMVPEMTQLVAFTPTETVDSEILGEDTFLVASYKVYQGKELTSYIFVVETVGKLKGLQIAYAIDLATDRVIQVKVVQTKETPEYFARLTTAFYNQFTNYSFDRLNITVDAISGATMSSDAFKVALTYVRLQYALLTDFVIPSALVLVESVRYNTDFTTLNGKPLIATIYDVSQDQTMDVYLTGGFDFVEVLTPGAIAPSAAAIAELKASAARDFASYGRVFATSFNTDTNALVVRTRGYAGFITVSMQIKSDYSAVTSLIEIVSFESYFDGGYQTRGDAPGLETYLFNRYFNEQSIDAAAGATYTYQGMTALFDYLTLLFTASNGGE